VIECLCNGMCISRDMTRMPVALFGPVYKDVSRPLNRPTVQTEIKSTPRWPRTSLFSSTTSTPHLSFFFSFVCSSSLPLILLLYYLPS
jgi:hypothetical protein